MRMALPWKRDRRTGIRRSSPPPGAKTSLRSTPSHDVDWLELLPAIPADIGPGPPAKSAVFAGCAAEGAYGAHASNACANRVRPRLLMRCAHTFSAGCKAQPAPCIGGPCCEPYPG